MKYARYGSCFFSLNLMCDKLYPVGLFKIYGECMIERLQTLLFEQKATRTFLENVFYIENKIVYISRSLLLQYLFDLYFSYYFTVV